MWEYTSHGHCGILTDDRYIDNDKTLKYLSEITISHEKAGNDIISPSDIIDKMIKVIM